MVPTVTLLATFVLAGCSSGGTDSSSTPSTTSPAPPTTVVPGGCADFRGSTTSLSAKSTGTVGFLTDAQVEQLDCLDKITFTFDPAAGEPPGYTVQYQDVAKESLTDCGEPITLPGNAFLVVVLQPAASNNPFLPVDDQQTYRGNLRLQYRGAHHLEIVQKTCDGEGTVNWIIGLDGVRPFVVDRAENPSRVNVLIG